MQISFTKMQGLGNDFMVIDNTNGQLTLNQAQIRQLSNRHFGVGFDQLLMVENSNSQNVDFRYVIYNADGTEVEQCGNGARCFARFVTEKGLTQNNPITVETKAGLMSLLLEENHQVRVDMGEPNFEPQDIPLEATTRNDFYQIEDHELGALSIGNPHCVLMVDDIDDIDIKTISDRIQNSSLLPNQANIGFMQIINSGEIRLRVYERGVGETLACGSGACAAVIHGVQTGHLDNSVLVHLPGGDAVVEYTKGQHVFLLGPAEFVFEGEVQI